MTPNIDKIIEHYNHAREKHPYFCDMLFSPAEICKSETKLAFMRNVLKHSIYISADDILACEYYEMLVDVKHSNTPAAIEEAYDTIAVLLRVIDVLEGRQKLGKPEEAKQC